MSRKTPMQRLVDRWRGPLVVPKGTVFDVPDDAKWIAITTTGTGGGGGGFTQAAQPNLEGLQQQLSGLNQVYMDAIVRSGVVPAIINADLAGAMRNWPDDPAPKKTDILPESAPRRFDFTE